MLADQGLTRLERKQQQQVNCWEGGHTHTHFPAAVMNYSQDQKTVKTLKVWSKYKCFQIVGISMTYQHLF